MNLKKENKAISSAKHRAPSRLYKKFLCLPFFLLLLSMQSLPEGMHYEHRHDPSIPLSVHILEVDPNAFIVKPVHAGNNLLALAPTSSIAKKEHAIAAINGGFYRMTGPYAGTPSGILKIQGNLLSSPRRDRGAIGWSEDGKILFDRIGMSALLKIEKLFLPIDGINQPRSSGQAILYSSSLGPTTLTPLDGEEMAIDQNHRVISSQNRGNTSIPKGGYVYSIDPACPFNLPQDSKTAMIDIELIPFNHPENSSDWQQIDHIVGGTPLLITDGKLITDYSIERTIPTFLSQRHPRTAIGMKKNGHLVLVVVEGRIPSLSVGLTMLELAKLMQSLGCEYALNLDGGGSSTLYLQGKVVNQLSGDSVEDPEKMERPVSDAILVLPKK